jgi:putative ABC transport system substrate-binding protein
MKIHTTQNTPRASRKRKFLRSVLCALFMAFCVSVRAQQSANVPRIGYLLDVPASTISSRIDAFRHDLRDLGYIEGKNIIIEWRDANGNFDRTRELADELVHLKVGVLVSPGPSVTRVLREATSTIPIVMAQDTDPSAADSPLAWHAG